MAQMQVSYHTVDVVSHTWTLLLPSSYDNSTGSDDYSSLNPDNVIFTKIQGKENENENKMIMIIQNTSKSKPAQVRHAGQPSHEVVFALPLKQDGKVYSGTVTSTASKPIEVEVLHTYAPNEEIDSAHSAPYHALLPGNNSIAITHLMDMVDKSLEVNATQISSDSINFVGNALVFHKTSGEPFTVTYTIDAKIKDTSKGN